VANVHTIPPDISFVDALARGLLDRSDGDPLALSEALVLLPTRRACRALAEAFLRVNDGAPLLLPRLVPLGDVDDDELSLQTIDGALPDAAEIPPAIPELRRRLLLTRLILAVDAAEGGGPTNPAQAARLAAELARLLDQFQTERLGFDRLAGLVPEEFARHWQVTLQFLKIVTEHWPAVVAEQGAIDPAERRNRVAAAQIEAWRLAPPKGLVVAAGSTGTIPATADLIVAVAGLATGAVVLPGLDTTLDAATCKAMGASHPQYGMVRLLERLGLAPSEVAPWPSPPGEADYRERTRVLAAIMSPAELDPVRLDNRDLVRALGKVRRVDCPGPREEATVIALMMREALETPGKTVALVTSDRALARRVAGELRRWDIEVDDSAGEPLDRSPPGSFLRLTARLVAEEFAPVPLLAVLKHPLAAAGGDPVLLRAQARQLEMLTLRGPRPGPGVDGLRAALGARPAPDVRALLDWLEAATASIRGLMAARRAGVTELLAAQVGFAESLAGTANEGEANGLWSFEAGEALADFVAELAQAADTLPPIPGSAWPGLLDALMQGRPVRPRYGRHPRLHIWGQLEARLQRADMVILGGLNEGTWPAEPDVDPWLSRPMRADLGLPPAERRIGLAAHDFAQAFAAREVVLTRSTRVDGTPTVPCRWLLRLDNVLAAAGTSVLVTHEAAKWLAWQDRLDRPTDPVWIRAPAPVPPVAARPRQLSVTQVEALVRDPYSVYARHILRLRPLDPIDADPGAAERGTLIHAALDEFMKTYPEGLPPDARKHLIAIGRRKFAEASSSPGVLAYWWPRFERIADWFIAEETERRRLCEVIHAEVKGHVEIAAPAGPFTLTAVADRIERRKDGSLVIADYKTGGLPPKSDVAAGFAPQLPLEGVIAEAGGFPGVPAGAVGSIEFWQVRGSVPPGEIRAAADDPDAIANARRGLEGLIALFDDPLTPYVARPYGDRNARTADYDHLERVKEWLARGRKDEA
jgi:ATP-dependent helicase/nuclease subunit B